MGINILSLFDGMSCGMLALQRAGIKVDNYFASEIDKFAIQVSRNNFPEIVQVGDVRNINKSFDKMLHDWNGKSMSSPRDIDLIVGGSPCQGFSFAGKQLNFEDTRSKLFFEYVRILKEVKPKYFLLENVKMKKEYQDIISDNLYGVQPIEINSSLLSAQNRRRLYRVGERQEDGTYKQVNIEQPQDKGILLKDILEDKVDEKYYLSNEVFERLKKFESNARLSDTEGKSYCLNTMQGGHRQPKIMRNVNPSRNGMNGNVYNTENKSPTITTNKGEGIKILQRARGFNKGGEHTEKSTTLSSNSWQENNYLSDSIKIRKLTPVECERLQTVPDGYTSSVSNSQRYKMLGNGRTISVISHILLHLHITDLGKTENH